jgi:hypothetical protein
MTTLTSPERPRSSGAPKPVLDGAMCPRRERPRVRVGRLGQAGPLADARPARPPRPGSTGGRPMTGEEFVESFASLDRARLTRMSEPAQERQLIARQVLLEYVETLWQDVQRSGERPDIGEKYQALATVLALTRSLSSVAFETVYDRWSP